MFLAPFERFASINRSSNRFGLSIDVSKIGDGRKVDLIDLTSLDFTLQIFRVTKSKSIKNSI